MLFSAFVLAVDCFVLRPSRFVTHATRRELCTLAGTWEQIRTKILSAFGGMMAGPCVGACGNFFWLRHDAQNCFKSSKNKQRIIHSKTKTKLSSAMPKRRKKASRQQCRSRISTSPTPCCDFFCVQRQMALARSFIKPERQLHFANSPN